MVRILINQLSLLPIFLARIQSNIVLNITTTPQRCIASINVGFDLSPTYPERFVMPTCFLASGFNSARASHRSNPAKWHHSMAVSPPITLDESTRACLQQLTSFRSNKRFPVVCWKSPDSGLVLMRSSQPMVGFLGARYRSSINRNIWRR